MNSLENYKKLELDAGTALITLNQNAERTSSALIEKMIKMAVDARAKAYAPYTNYTVGAALLCKDETIYTGCNVETAALCGICAERNAVFKAVSDGKKEFVAIAVIGGKEGKKAENCTPCGVCRQVLAEFVNPDEFIVIFRDEDLEISTATLNELLPYSFGGKNLK